MSSSRSASQQQLYLPDNNKGRCYLRNSSVTSIATTGSSAINSMGSSSRRTSPDQYNYNYQVQPQEVRVPRIISGSSLPLKPERGSNIVSVAGHGGGEVRSRVAGGTQSSFPKQQRSSSMPEKKVTTTTMSGGRGATLTPYYDPNPQSQVTTTARSSSTRSTSVGGIGSNTNTTQPLRATAPPMLSPYSSSNTRYSSVASSGYGVPNSRSSSIGGRSTSRSQERQEPVTHRHRQHHMAPPAFVAGTSVHRSSRADRSNCSLVVTDDVSDGTPPKGGRHISPPSTRQHYDGSTTYRRSASCGDSSGGGSPGVHVSSHVSSRSASYQQPPSHSYRRAHSAISPKEESQGRKQKLDPVKKVPQAWNQGAGRKRVPYTGYIAPKKHHPKQSPPKVNTNSQLSRSRSAGPRDEKYFTLHSPRRQENNHQSQEGRTRSGAARGRSQQQPQSSSVGSSYYDNTEQHDESHYSDADLFNTRAEQEQYNRRNSSRSPLWETEGTTRHLGLGSSSSPAPQLFPAGSRRTTENNNRYDDGDDDEAAESVRVESMKREFLSLLEEDQEDEYRRSVSAEAQPATHRPQYQHSGGGGGPGLDLGADLYHHRVGSASVVVSSPSNYSPYHDDDASPQLDHGDDGDHSSSRPSVGLGGFSQLLSPRERVNAASSSLPASYPNHHGHHHSRSSSSSTAAPPHPRQLQDEGAGYEEGRYSFAPHDEEEDAETTPGNRLLISARSQLSSGSQTARSVETTVAAAVGTAGSGGHHSSGHGRGNSQPSSSRASSTPPTRSTSVDETVEELLNRADSHYQREKRKQPKHSQQPQQPALETNIRGTQDENAAYHDDEHHFLPHQDHSQESPRQARGSVGSTYSPHHHCPYVPVLQQAEDEEEEAGGAATSVETIPALPLSPRPPTAAMITAGTSTTSLPVTPLAPKPRTTDRSSSPASHVSLPTMVEVGETIKPEHAAAEVQVDIKVVEHWVQCALLQDPPLIRRKTISLQTDAEIPVVPWTMSRYRITRDEAAGRTTMSDLEASLWHSTIVQPLRLATLERCVDLLSNTTTSASAAASPLLAAASSDPFFESINGSAQLQLPRSSSDLQPLEPQQHSQQVANGTSREDLLALIEQLIDDNAVLTSRLREPHPLHQ